MTVDLQTMLDLRDLQVAMDVQKKAELGYFDSEFTVYGCSYLQNGLRYYKVSAEAEKIYDFVEQGAQLGLLPSNVHSMTKTCAVPMGMRDYIAREVKRELALQLREQYTKDFFVYLENVAKKVTEEQAMPILLEEQKKIAGCFDELQLRCFRERLDYAYQCRKLTLLQYQLFMNWLTEEYRSMEENIISKDIFEKTFYGIAYESANGIAYVDNARKEAIYRKKYELEQSGVFVTPIFWQTYWYNYTLRLPDVHKKFVQELCQMLDADCIAMLKKISRQNGKMSGAEFLKHADEVYCRFGEAARKTFLQYGYRWGIL